MSEFGTMLGRLISGKYNSRRSFVRAAEPGAKENVAQAYVSKVITKDVPAPLARLNAWADALDLRGDERDRFMDLAVKSHASDAVLAMIGRLEREVKRLSAENAELRGQSSPDPQVVPMPAASPASAFPVPVASPPGAFRGVLPPPVVASRRPTLKIRQPDPVDADRK